jgi:arylsulfatase A
MNIQPHLRSFLFAVLLALGVQPSRAADRPNVVLVLADDLGYECLGANGSTSYKTPNLDRLAKEGTRFERCYAQPLCTPTRAQLMTGHYNIRNYTVFGRMEPELKTFGNLFKEAGYATGIVGKWQLGRQVDLPAKFGFDEAFLWQHLRRPPRYANPGLEINGVPKDYSNGEYGPDVLNGFAIDFIRRHKAQPLFLYYPLTLTHGPYLPTPDSPDWDPKAKGEPKGKQQRHFADMVAYMDKLVGALDGALASEGVRDNTLLIFVGDNGTGAGTRSQIGDKTLVGAKGQPTETGMRVPLVVSWPKTAAAGRVIPDLVDTTDFLPTIAEAAGIAIPPAWKPDGRSFLPQVRGERGNPREWMYSWYAPRGVFKHEFAADARWKLYRDGKFVDTTEDPGETRPLDPAALTAEAQAARAKLQMALAQFVTARPEKLVELTHQLNRAAPEPD